MSNGAKGELKQYAELGFRARRQKIEDEYQEKLTQALHELGSHGYSYNSSAREATELRLRAEKIGQLVLGKAEVLLEAYESHKIPIDEREIMEELTSLSIQSMGGAASSYRGQADLKASRTGQHDPSSAARGAEFGREMQRRSSASLTEARHLIQKRKLAQQNQPLPQPTHVHYEYHLNGVNPRLNLGGMDQSINTIYIQPDEIFGTLRSQLESAISDKSSLAEIVQKLDALEAAQGTPTFAEKLGTFLAFAANSMTIVTPFIPALSEMAHKAMS